MKRYLDFPVKNDLSKKMMFVTGPRQVGKTTLSQMLLAQSNGQYLNYDVAEHRAVVLSRGWNDSSKLIVLDEIHKMPD